MPHVSLKLYAGRSEAKKQAIAKAIVDAIKAVDGCDETYISVLVEDFDPSEWKEKVYDQEIAANWDKLLKKPGYQS